MAGGRKPDFDVCVSERPESRDAKRFYANVGSAWRSDKGDMINIQLRPGVALVGGRNIDITLFPFKPRDSRGGSSGGGPGPTQGGFADNPGDDDIPFLFDETQRDGAP